jgi:hypothetical protein
MWRLRRRLSCKHIYQMRIILARFIRPQQRRRYPHPNPICRTSQCTVLIPGMRSLGSRLSCRTSWQAYALIPVEWSLLRSMEGVELCYLLDESDGFGVLSRWASGRFLDPHAAHTWEGPAATRPSFGFCGQLPGISKQVFPPLRPRLMRTQSRKARLLLRHCVCTRAHTNMLARR